jgi:hypothetical protein
MNVTLLIQTTAIRILRVPLVLRHQQAPSPRAPTTRPRRDRYATTQ